MASSSNTGVSDTAANSEEPSRSSATPSHLPASSSEESIYDLCEAIVIQSGVYGAPRSGAGFIPGTVVNPEEPSRSSAAFSVSPAASSETSTIYDTPLSDSGSIPGTSSGASSYDTARAYLTSEGGSTSSPHSDFSSESSNSRPKRDVIKMIQYFMNQGDSYTAASIKVGYILRHDSIREDFARNGYNDVPYDPEDRCNVRTQPPGTGRK